MPEPTVTPAPTRGLRGWHLGMLSVLVAGLVLAGCGGSSPSATTTTSAPTTAPVTTAPATTPASTTAATTAATTGASTSAAAAPEMMTAAVGSAAGKGTVSITYNEPVTCPSGVQANFVYTQLFSGGSGSGAGEVPPADTITCSGRSVVLTFSAVASIPLPGQLVYRPSLSAAAINAGGRAALAQSIDIDHDASGALVTCQPGQLTTLWVSGGAAAGTVDQQYAFGNTSSFPCTLFGFPGMALLGASGTALPTTVIRGPAGGASATPQLVTLANGGRAYFVITFPDATGYSGVPACPTSTSLEFTPPNDFAPVYLTGPGAQIQPFGGTVENLQCGTITISPVLANPLPQ